MSWLKIKLFHPGFGIAIVFPSWRKKKNAVRRRIGNQYASFSLDIRSGGVTDYRIVDGA